MAANDASREEGHLFELRLTPAQLKLTHTALKVLHDDLGHEERDVRLIVDEVLAKLPDEHSIRAITIGPPPHAAPAESGG